MERNDVKMKLKDWLDIIPDVKPKLEEIEKASLDIEENIKYHFCMQDSGLEQVEKTLAQIRALKEQFNANIGINGIVNSIRATLISATAAIFSGVLSLFDTSDSMKSVVALFMIILLVVNVGFLIYAYFRTAKDKNLIFKCAYIEQYLSDCIAKRKNEEEQADSEK